MKTETENDPENPEKVTEKSPKKKSKKEYTCQLCFKSFKDSYKLKRHGKVHQVRVSERMSCEELAIFFQILQILSFSSHFSFFVLVDKNYEKRKYYVIVCLFFIIFNFCLVCLALQTENILQKITQHIFVFGNFVNQNKNQKMG